MSKLLLLLAAFGAVLGIISDCLLLWSPDALFDFERLDYLGNMSSSNMLLGNYLGVSGIPLEFLAIFAFLKDHKIAWKQMACILLALFMLTFGILFHAHLLVQHEFMAKGLQLEMTLQAMEVYKAIVGLSFAIAGVLIAVGIWRRWVHLPKWTILLSPLCTYGLWLVLNVVYPPVGNVLLLAGLNLSFLIFFLIALFFTEPKSNELLPNSRH